MPCRMSSAARRYWYRRLTSSNPNAYPNIAPNKTILTSKTTPGADDRHGSGFMYWPKRGHHSLRIIRKRKTYRRLAVSSPV